MYYVLIAAIAAVLYLLYWYLTLDFNYWRDRNIKYLKPYVFIGSMLPVMTKKKTLGQFLRDIYMKFPEEPYVGLFLGNRPCLLVRDKDLMQELTKDFEHFPRRMMEFDEEKEIVVANSLFALSSSKWKNARHGLTPGFTSAKLKHYLSNTLPIINEMNYRIDQSKTQDIAKLVWCFAVDSVTRSLFGLDGNAMLNPKDEMLRISNQLYRTDFLSVLAKFLLFTSPPMYNTLRMQAFPQKAIESIKSITWDFMKTIDKIGVSQTHFMSVLHNLRQKELADPGKAAYTFDGDLLISQVFAFIIAGTDTMSAAMTFSVYELAKNKKIQDKLREEVMEHLGDGFESLTFDKLMSMKYLNMIVMETLRLHSPFPLLDRKCTKDYVPPGSNHVIKKGTYLFVPMLGFHMDEKYWENPTEFNPERFDDMEAINSKPFLPFGLGPRTCIGMRFAQQSIRLLLTSLAYKWRWQLADKNSTSFQYNPLTYTLLPDKPINITFEALS